MKTAISSSIILLILVLNMDLFSQSGWTRQPVNTTRTLIGLYFLNNNTGWAVGDSGVICKTTNGGSNWIKTTYSAGGTLVSLYFKNELTGLIGGYNVSHLNGFVIRTTNSGSTWSRSNYTGEPYDLFSLGGDTVWCSRHDGYVMKSTNLGITWTPTFVRAQLELYSICFSNSTTGWTGGAVYGGSAYIYNTSNGGANWVSQIVSSTDHFYSIYFVNSQSGFASTLNGAVYKTTNGGTNWLRILNGVSFALFKLRFPDINTGIAVGQNRTIMKTRNGGAFWYMQVLPLNISSYISFYSVNFRDTSLGWAVGDSGIILKTTNSGELLGMKPISNITPEKYELFQNYPNPFNPSTAIEFDIPKSSFTKITVYDSNGEEVITLVNEHLHTGKYKVDFNAYELSSGIYYCRMNAGEFTQARKLVLLK